MRSVYGCRKRCCWLCHGDVCKLDFTSDSIFYSDSIVSGWKIAKRICRSIHKGWRDGIFYRSGSSRSGYFYVSGRLSEAQYVCCYSRRRCDWQQIINRESSRFGTSVLMLDVSGIISRR
ncbi:hypothetical protein D3C86_1122240 [compost metagenome]